MIPLIISNRINNPIMAEKILVNKCADMVSMARPFLADAEFVKKVKEGRVDEINTYICCNQAYLDQILVGNNIASHAINPRACHEMDIVFSSTLQPKKLAVVMLGYPD